MNLRRLLVPWLWLAALVASPAGSAVEREPLRMGFYMPAIRDANLADLKVSLGLWTEEIGRPYGIRIFTSTYDDMTALRRALDQRELNFISAPGMELAEVFKPGEIKQGYARRQEGVDEGIALIVSKASGIRQFADLRGKRVLRLNRDRLAEYFLETQCLKTAGQACKDYLNLVEERRDIQSVYAVFFGKADAALVSLATLRTAVELNPQIRQRLTPILEWKAPALMFGLMTWHTDDSYRNLIVNSIKDAMKTLRGRQILELFKTDYLEPVDADALKPYWALLKEYQELRKGNRGGRK